MIQAFFSKEPIYRERRPELDLAKTILIICLSFVHCTIECTAEENLVSGIPYVLDSVIGGPLGAPMFMFAMGVGMAYWKCNTIKDFALRGIRLFAGGFLLNICRYTIPYLLGFWITEDYNKYIDPIWYRTLCNDMLQFAGLTMLVIALFRKWKIPVSFMVLIGLFMSLCGNFFNGIDVGNPAGNIFLGYLVGTEDAAGKVISDFPILNWFIVPAVGYLFGECLVRVKDKNKIYRYLSPVCLLITVLYFIRGISQKLGMFGEGQNCYYHIVTSDVLVSLAAAVGALGVYFYIGRWIPKRLMHWIKDTSSNLNLIYCIHWVMLVLVINVALYAVRGTQELPIWMVMLLSSAIALAAIVVSHMWKERKDWIRKNILSGKKY